MKVEYINPFIESTNLVLEQLVQVKPDRGKLEVRDVTFKAQHIWIKIGVTGQLDGHVLFGIHEEVALKLVSAMMGGFSVTELDEMSQSAISELGNMISGNASTMLSNQGVVVDITPPQVILEDSQFLVYGKALSVPINVSQIGEINLQVIIRE
jgi:chemotaxis protein CheX